jgi:3-phosphoshikimate 1-carboxyvinyltransferase
MPALLRALHRLGADIHSTKPDDSPPFVVFGGGLNGGKVKLSEAEARYLPAVFLPAPYAKKKVEFSVPSSKENLHLEPTLGLMKTARAKITERRGVVSVLNQPYRAFSYRVHGEVVGAAPFIVAAGLLNSRLKVRGAKEMSLRDANFLQTLKSFGLKLHASGKSIEVEGRHRLRGTQLDLSWAPELLPLMAVLSCAAGGKTLIRNAGEARTMKSDRISAVAQELRRMHARVLEQSDGLVIQGPAKLKGCEVDGHDDYAVVSALVVAGLLAEGKTVIKNGAEALSTSYSRFVSTFQSRGAEMSYSS